MREAAGFREGSSRSAAEIPESIHDLVDPFPGVEGADSDETLAHATETDAGGEPADLRGEKLL